MKQITADLKITGIDISIARLGATVTFKYLDEYEAKAWYLRRSSGNNWLESLQPPRIHEAITKEVEENEEEITEWIEDQFAKETDQVDPVKKTYDILQLQKMNSADLALIAYDFSIQLEGLKKQELIYAILEKQAKS